MAKILSFTTPSDACRSSTVSSGFHAAAQSDIVWDRFLPTDWEFLISRIKPSDINFDPTSCSKKDIFFALSDNPVLIDDGKKSMSLDIWTGKKCIMLGARELSILWSDDNSSYWTWEQHHRSRFAEVAVLNDVWWFEIRGKISCRRLSPATTYTAHFVFKMKKRKYYGFDFDPVDATVGIIGGESCTRSVCLDPYLDNPPWLHQRIPWAGSNLPENNMSELEQPRLRPDGWFEIELGEFQTDGGGDEVEVVVMEFNGSSPKSGLVVEGIEMRPKIGPNS